MINLLGKTCAAEVEAVVPCLLHPTAEPLSGWGRRTSQWGLRVWQWLALYWCRKLHRRHHQRTRTAGGHVKVGCACCGRSFIRVRNWRRFGHDIVVED